MSKISLIIEREYLSRVRKKSFIIMSLVGPLLFAAMFVLPTWFGNMKDTSEKRIAVIDNTFKYKGEIKDTESLKFVYPEAGAEVELRREMGKTGYYAFVIISDDLLLKPDAVEVFSDVQIAMEVKQHIARSLKEVLKGEILAQNNHINGLEGVIERLKSVSVKVKTMKIGGDGSQKESSTELTMVIGVVFSVLTYMFILLYGVQVMRGVMEEKTSRIVEVIISSVKPFQLMMGKILGVALVALTQFVVWLVLTLGVVYFIQMVVFPLNELPVGVGGSVMAAEANDASLMFHETLNMVVDANLAWSVLAFLFFFMGGYFVYAGLFAALGSAVDSETDTQQFVMPVTMPLILSIYVAMAAFRNPDGAIAFWFSMFPLTSPVVMMARIPFDIPLWEVLLSMFILVLFFVLVTWFAARVYRTGILMYGKKISFKEIWKWFVMAGR